MGLDDTTSRFDEIIDRRGTRCMKWDTMQAFSGVDPADGLAMWVADMDFRPPDCVLDALRAAVDHGVFGYLGDQSAYRAAIQRWMSERHDWEIDPDWIFTTAGLINAVAVALEAFTDPGDGVVLFTPVYHAFHRQIRSAGRRVIECPMVIEDGRYKLDFSTYDAQMTGRERMLIFCSPHNPGGRVWTEAEITAVAEFAARHSLMLVSDEIHHDLVYPGHRHRAFHAVAPDISDRLLMMTAPSKTFNLAGLHTGNVIVPDPVLREQFGARMAGLGVAANSLGMLMETAAYSPGGAAWVDELVTYLDGNRRLFDDGIATLPGARSMSLEATFLAWVDFSGTGMEPSEVVRRVAQDARIAVNQGPTFGAGGENWLRFNLGTNRTRIAEAVSRLQTAFRDLQ